VFIGKDMDEVKIRKKLDEILVTEDEFILGPEVWKDWFRLFQQQWIELLQQPGWKELWQEFQNAELNHAPRHHSHHRHAHQYHAHHH